MICDLCGRPVTTVVLKPSFQLSNIGLRQAVAKKQISHFRYPHYEKSSEEHSIGFVMLEAFLFEEVDLSQITASTLLPQRRAYFTRISSKGGKARQIFL